MIKYRIIRNNIWNGNKKLKRLSYVNLIDAELVIIAFLEMLKWFDA